MLGKTAAKRMADGSDAIRRAAELSDRLVDQTVHMLAHLLVLVVDRKDAGDPAQIGNPVVRLLKIRTAECKDDFRARISATGPDLYPETVKHAMTTRRIEATNSCTAIMTKVSPLSGRSLATAVIDPRNDREIAPDGPSACKPSVYRGAILVRFAANEIGAVARADSVKNVVIAQCGQECVLRIGFGDRSDFRWGTSLVWSPTRMKASCPPCCKGAPEQPARTKIKSPTTMDFMLKPPRRRMISADRNRNRTGFC